MQIPAQNAIKLGKMIIKMRQYSRVIGMEFGEEKYATFRIKRGSTSKEAFPLELVDVTIMKHLRTEGEYTYLGIKQRNMKPVKLTPQRFDAKTLFEREHGGIGTSQSNNNCMWY